QGYIVNSVSNNVQVVDLSTGATVGVVSTGEGSNPMKLALGPDGRAYVTNLVTNNVAVIDLVSRTLVRTIDLSGVGSGPTGITLTGGKLYVTLTNFNLSDFSYGPGRVAVIPLSTLTVSRTVEVGTNPQDAIVGPDLRVHVAATGNYGDIPGRVDVIDPARDEVVATIPLGGTPASLTAATGTRVFVADGSRGVLAYDAATRQILFDGEHAIAGAQVANEGSSIFDVKFDPQTGLVYAADFPKDRVFAIDPATGSIVSVIGVGDGPAALGVYPQ
ncbi:MAG: YncE family protein, partial [Armatimonadota bacterium]|nr:YncE family protein [Armatimonadota bacterium]